MKKKFTHFIKVVTGKAYRELKDELRETEKIIRTKERELDSINDELTKTEETCETLANQIDILEANIVDLTNNHKAQLEIIEARHFDTVSTATNELNNLKTEMKKLEVEFNKLVKKYEKKNDERKAAVKELKRANKTIEEQNSEITKLKEQVEFLKSHKRAPSLEEIKTYASGRKHTKAEGK